MTVLSTSSNFSNPDDFFAAFRRAHSNLNEESSAALNIKLVLLLANHIGDLRVFEQAIAIATKSNPDLSK